MILEGQFNDDEVPNLHSPTPGVRDCGISISTPPLIPHKVKLNSVVENMLIQEIKRKPLGGQGEEKPKER